MTDEARPLRPFPPQTIRRWLEGETVENRALYRELVEWAEQIRIPGYTTVNDDPSEPARWQFSLAPGTSMTVKQYGEFIRYVESLRREWDGRQLIFTITPRPGPPTR